MSQNPLETSTEIFQNKPYLKIYFQDVPNEGLELVEIFPKPSSGSEMEENPREYYVSLNKKALASQFSPRVQAERLIASQKISSKDVVVVLGLGNPELLRLLSETSPSGQVLLFIDVHTSMANVLWKSHLNSIMRVPGRHLFCGENSLSLLWNYLESLPVERIQGVRIFKNPASLSVHPEFYNEIDSKIRSVFSAKMSDLLTKFEFERIWIKNTVYNTLQYHKGNRFLFESLKNQFQGIPALLVSAGPSLRSHIEKILPIRDKLFIFSCDTSTKVLTKNGIIPDAVMTLDAQTHSLFHFLGEDFSQIPLFADMVTSPLILRTNSFPSIVHSLTAKFSVDADGSFVRETTAGGEFAREVLGEVGDIQSGGSVATTALDAIRQMGFSEIYLIGQDLAYTGREIHSTGTHHNEKWLTLLHRKQSLERINEAIIRKRETRFVDSVNGGEVLTDYVLDLYRHWFEESGSQIGVPTFNINTKGAKIKNIPEITPETALEKLNSYPSHGYPWKQLSPWMSMNSPLATEIVPEKKSKPALPMASDIQSTIQKLLKECRDLKNKTTPTTESPTDGGMGEQITEDMDRFLKEIRSSSYLKRIFRKTEIYIARHRESLVEDKKRNLILQSLETELRLFHRALRSLGQG